MSTWQYVAVGWALSICWAYLFGAMCMHQHLTGRWFPALRQDPETDEERDARFAPGNDATWGEGNWIRCDTCPPDSEGRAVYHHRDAHQADPAPTDHRSDV